MHLPSEGQCLLCQMSIYVGWLVEIFGLPHRVICGRGTGPPVVLDLWSRKTWNLSELILNHKNWGEFNCSELKGPEDERTDFRPFPRVSAYGLTSSCSHSCLCTPCVCYSLVQWLVSEHFCAHNRNYLLLEDDAYLSTCLHVVFPYCSCLLPLTLVIMPPISVWASFRSP
jgi:hypothetical protein